MKQYGLIGYPLSHSFSKKYFTEKFDTAHITDSKYDLFPIDDITQLPALLKENPGLCGLNVTIPYKVDVLNYLDQIEAGAKSAGAVNCIRISAGIAADVKNHGFRLEGFNTDIYGFEMSLRPLLKDYHKSALVLGDGGAARAVKCVLEKLRIPFRVVTRKTRPGNILFDNLEPNDIKQNLLIINTTPIGTSPNVDDCPPIPYHAITDKHLLYDLVYNPEKTLFLQKGQEKGAIIKNGHEMLILQAEKSWEIWTAKNIQS